SLANAANWLLLQTHFRGEALLVAARALPCFIASRRGVMYQMNSLMKTCQTARYSGGLHDVAPESALWIINLVLVFIVSRYLFGMNSLAIFFGWDPTSMLAFLGERHRFSDILFGLGSDPIKGLGNIAFTVNQNWFPSLVLSKDPSG